MLDEGVLATSVEADDPSDAGKDVLEASMAMVSQGVVEGVVVVLDRLLVRATSD